MDNARAGRDAGPTTGQRRDRGVKNWTLRLGQFFLGLALCSVAVWLSLQADLGLAPWDVLHAGVSDRVGISFGLTVILTGVIVVIVSAFLDVYPGVGTVLNVILIGVGIDLLLATSWLDGLADANVGLRFAVLFAATVTMGAGAALYIGAGLGAGPRDSLMVAFHKRGLTLGWSRLILEVSVLIAGWLLGGKVGVGTVFLALGTGFIVQASFRVLRQKAF